MSCISRDTRGLVETFSFLSPALLVRRPRLSIRGDRVREAVRTDRSLFLFIFFFSSLEDLSNFDLLGPEFPGYRNPEGIGTGRPHNSSRRPAAAPPQVVSGDADNII